LTHIVAAIGNLHVVNSDRQAVVHLACAW